MVLAFGFSLIQSVVVLVLLVVFGGDPQRPVELARLVLPHAAATALLAPVVFAHRLMLAPGAPPAYEVVRACSGPAIERLSRAQLRRP